jgi:hypothetical protein
MLLVPATLAIVACVQESPTAINMRNVNESPAILIIDDPPPAPSCTYTQGYWKQHPELWDDASDGMVFLTSDQFYNSGVSNLTIMKMPPKGGNAYEILAHQFIAASLNMNGAASSGVSEVDAAMADAAAYFSGQPAGIPSPVDPTRSQLVAWSSTLDSFNSGIIGPGHCS